MGFKKYDGSTWQPITPKKLKGIPYTGALPAVLTGTKAGYLHKYKIYGNTEQIGTPTPENPIVPSECGERTENLFDASNALNNARIGSNGEVVTDITCVLSGYITVLPDKSYTQSTQFSYSNALAEFDENKVFIKRYISGNGTITTSETTSFIRVSCAKTLADSFMLNSGSTALPYKPYGYKLPLTSGNTPVDIYIGDDTLSTEEYVDSGTGKIHRMVDGTLTPTDPPIPFPQIPTSANSTTISWAGSGLAPSKFDSIQEWVDIPTYTYTNGAWVEDN